MYLCGLAAALKHDRQLRVRFIDSAPDEALHELKMMQPDVIVAENNQVPREWRRRYAELLFIEIEPQTDLLHIFWGERFWIASLEELPLIIRNYKKLGDEDGPEK